MGTSKRFIAKNGLDNNSQTIQNVDDPVNAQDAATKNSASNASNLTTGTLSAARLPAFTGDATSTAGTSALTLANSGVTASTYKSVTVDAKGRVTAGTNPTTLAGYGITDAAASSHNHTLDGLSNTTITSNTAGEILKWSGSAWINNTLSQAGIAAASHTHAGTDITSAVANATTAASCSGNAATATALATARTIAGTSFNGTANISIDHGNLTGLTGDDHTMYVKADGTRAFTAVVSGVTPTADAHLTTKAYVDGVAQGLDVKAACRVATTANVTLAGGAPSTLDGITLVANNRILVKNQTTTSQNGIYIVQTLGTGSDGTWVRASDFDGTPAGEVSSGAFTFVTEGTVGGGNGWVLTTNDTITIGTTGLTFAQFSGAGEIIAGTGITKSGNTLSLTSGVVTTGTYKSVTVDTYGRVTAGTNPTTLAGYGITDAAASSHNHTLDGLSNTTITSVATGEIIKWSGSAWINNTLAEAGISATSHNHTLDGLSNTTITSVATGEIIKWSGSAWINNTLAEAGISATSHNHDADYSDVAHTHANVVAAGAAGFMTGADKTKLDGIAIGANNYTHPTGDGNLHVVATGTTHNGHFLKAGATAGSISWVAVAMTDLSDVTITTPASGHVLYHNGTQFVNGTLATAGISATSHTHANVVAAGAAGFMTGADKTKLDGIATSANNYSHPTGDGNLHVPATSTTNNGKFLKAGATAGAISWTTANLTDLGDVTITTPATGHVVYYSGSSFINATLSTAGIAAASHTHPGTAITSAVANATTAASCSGNAATATAWDTARTLTLTGDVTGTSAAFDGSGNISISTTVVDNSHNHTNYADKAAASYALPATAGWYRIAQSALGISRNGGIFSVEWTVSGCHGRVVFTAGTHYGNAAGTTIGQLSFTTFSTNGITKARIVYHTTYTDNYAYVEVYLSSASAVTLTTTIIDSLGWSLLGSQTAGSIPAGYSNKELTFDAGIVSIGDITSYAQLRSTVATGTKPLDVTSTTVCTNLNADLLDGNHSSAFATASHTHAGGDITSAVANATTAATAGAWSTGRTITLTGDVTGVSAAWTGSGNISFATNIANSGVTAGTYKSVTVSADGRVTAGTNPTTLAGYGITDAASSTHNHTLDGLSNTTITSVASGEIIKWNGTAWINNTLAEAGISATSHNHTLDGLSNTTITSVASGELIKWNGTAWINNTLAEAGIAAASHTHAGGDITSAVATASAWATGRTITLTGDVTGVSAAWTGSGNISFATNIANSGVTAGTYKSVTVAADGRVTAGTNPTTLAGYGITDAATSTHTHTLTQLTDCNVTGATIGDIMYFNGTVWVDQDLATAGIAAASHTHYDYHMGVNLLPRANDGTATDATYNIGSATYGWLTVYANATSANYADLAEKYTVRGEVEVGRVVLVSEGMETDCEISDVVGSSRQIGIISRDPAFRMNDKLENGHHVARVGLVDCYVQGPVRKGQVLVSYLNGTAIAYDLVKDQISDSYNTRVATANESIESNDVVIIKVII